MTTPTPSAALDRRRALVAALLLAMLLMWFTGAIPRWGQWYAEEPFYRAQVAAFFEGRLALSHDVEAVTHDLAWVDGGVQHVWGLGVPLWLSVWEVVGRVVHVSPFPDRIAMLLGAALALYASLRAWFGPGGDRSAASRGAFLITAFFPGVITMMRGRLAVYEEADCYSYGTALLLLAGVIMMLRRPSTARYACLMAFAGATGLVRPTAWFYGVAAAIVATVLYVQHRGGVRRALRPVLVAIALFLAGGGALYATNDVRFGAGGEFGHSLNLEDLPGNLYATRFTYPFAKDVPLGDAAKELVGAMFGRPELHARPGYHFYDTKLHVWQAPEERWREYYFTSYTWAYLPIALFALGLVALCWARRRREPDAAAPPPVAATASLARETRWLGAWALLGTVPLLAFYLRSPSLSSRYLLDVAPGMAVLVVIAWRHVATWLAARGLGTVALVVFVAWWGWSILQGKDLRPYQSPVRVAAAIAGMDEYLHPLVSLRDVPASYDLDDPWLRLYVGGDQWECPCYLDPYEENACDHTPWAEVPLGGEPDVGIVIASDRRNGPLHMHMGDTGTACAAGALATDCDVDDPDAPPADGVDDPPYEIASRWRGDTLYRNGTNWDLTTGAVAPATYLFVDAPGEATVEVSPDSGTPMIDWDPQVRAKIELEELPLLGVASTARGVQFRFAAPKTPRYRVGLQVMFLGFGTPAHLGEATSGYTLQHVGWHAPEAP